MKVTLISIFLAAAFIGSDCAGYGAKLDELAFQLNSYIDDQIRYGGDYFTYPVQHLSYLSEYLGEQAASASDRKAGDHVLRSRSNYTATARAVIEIMNSTRDTILNDVLSKKQLVLGIIPSLEATSADLDQILRNRKCSASSIDQYFTSLFDEIQTNVYQTISEASQTFMHVVMHQFIPIYMIEDLFYKLQNCLAIELGHGLNCLLKTEDYYLSPAVNLVQESANQMANYVNNFNYRVSQGLVSEVEHEMLHAYQGVYKYVCSSYYP